MLVLPSLVQRYPNGFELFLCLIALTAYIGECILEHIHNSGSVSLLCFELGLGYSLLCLGLIHTLVGSLIVYHVASLEVFQLCFDGTQQFLALLGLF